MADELHDPLAQLSDALAARAEAAQAFVVAIRTRHHFRSGMLWGGDVVVASEQVFPKANEAEIRLMDGRDLKATLAGRDPGTNVVALRLDQPVATRRWRYGSEFPRTPSSSTSRRCSTSSM